MQSRNAGMGFVEAVQRQAEFAAAGTPGLDPWTAEDLVLQSAFTGEPAKIEVENCSVKAIGCEEMSCGESCCLSHAWLAE
jgi:hypothetical protein